MFPDYAMSKVMTRTPCALPTVASFVFVVMLLLTALHPWRI